MDITTLTTVLTGLQGSVKFLQDHFAKREDFAVKQKLQDINNSIISLQNHMIELQGKHSAIQEEKEQMERKLKDIEDWSSETNRYELKEIASDIYVYALKEQESNNEPAHYLCAKCFNDKNKSILQRVSKSMAGIKYICHSCNSEILDHSQESSSGSHYPGRSGSGGPNGWMGA